MMRIREETAELLMHSVSPRSYPSLITLTPLWMELCYVDIIEPQLCPFWVSVHSGLHRPVCDMAHHYSSIQFVAKHVSFQIVLIEI